MQNLYSLHCSRWRMPKSTLHHTSSAIQYLCHHLTLLMKLRRICWGWLRMPLFYTVATVFLMTIVTFLLFAQIVWENSLNHLLYQLNHVLGLMEGHVRLLLAQRPLSNYGNFAKVLLQHHLFHGDWWLVNWEGLGQRNWRVSGLPPSLVYHSWTCMCFGLGFGGYSGREVDFKSMHSGLSFCCPSFSWWNSSLEQ